MGEPNDGHLADESLCILGIEPMQKAELKPLMDAIAAKGGVMFGEVRAARGQLFVYLGRLAVPAARKIQRILTPDLAAQGKGKEGE